MDKQKVKICSDGIRVYCAHDALVDIEELKPNPGNPNQHPDEQVHLLAKIIRQNGWRNPVTVSTRSGYIVKGHGRLAAAQYAGMAEIPIDYQDYESDEAEIADLIADNRLAELAEMDNKRLAEMLSDLLIVSSFDFNLTGFSEADYKELMASISEDDILSNIADDIVPDVPMESFTKLGDIWEMGRHRLICGDATRPTDYIKLMRKDIADLIITDPPYNVDYEGSAGKILNDKQGDTEFRLFLLDAFTSMKQHAKPGAGVYVFHADSEGLNFRYAFREAGLQLRQCLVWVKNSLVLGRQDYQWRHEPCLYGWVDGGSHYFTADRSQTTVYEEDMLDFKKMKKAALIQYIEDHLQNPTVPSTVIFEDKPLRNDLHPTMKPIKLLARLMLNSSIKGNIVLDPFAGSGSTLIAADLTGRTARLIELDERFCDVIVRRYIMTTGRRDITLLRGNKKLKEADLQDFLAETDTEAI